jgi:hypothetical protein
MTIVAIIGGSGLTNLKNLRITRREVIRTPFGEPSAPMVYGQLGGGGSVSAASRAVHNPTAWSVPHNIWASRNRRDESHCRQRRGRHFSDFWCRGPWSFPDRRLHLWTRPLFRQRTQTGHAWIYYPYCDELRKS